jgi:hypothetical protein
MVNIERSVLRRIDALVMESKATCTTAFEEIRSVTADHSLFRNKQSESTENMTMISRAYCRYVCEASSLSGNHCEPDE